jgi:hypothetical protein
VSADGGASGLPTLTAARGGAAEPVSGGRYTAAAEGSYTLNFRAVDGAGNATVKRAAVMVDRTPPAASLSCAPGVGLTWVCSGSGSDTGGSGVQSVSYSIDGAAAALPSTGSFVALKGTVVVSAVDAAGNVGSSAPVTLADRTPPPVAPPTTTPPPPVEVTPRTANEAVFLKRGAKSSSRLVGQLTLSATPTTTTIDLRPLALGRGRFKFVVKVKSGRKTRTVRKTVKTRRGYSPRIRMRTRVAARTKVTVSVKRRSGRRWVSYATGRATLD